MTAGSVPTILIVDDDFAMRSLLERFLVMLGYRALVAKDGNEAVRLAQDNPEIALIMLDVVMSGLSGRQLAEQLTATLPNALILFCSGHPAASLTRLGIDLGAAQFIQKPCRPMELKRRLSEMLVTR